MSTQVQRITMMNPRNNVVIVTNSAYKHKWEQLGFKVVENVSLFKLSVAM